MNFQECLPTLIILERIIKAMGNRSNPVACQCAKEGMSLGHPYVFFKKQK